jgi:subtilisin family serine protease
MVPGTVATEDCAGHGTHVAGTIGGTEYGVAKGVTLVPVRVFGCEGTTDTATVRAIEWVNADHYQHPGQLAVANMSPSGPESWMVDGLVNGSISLGIVYTVGAGNQGVDACTVSPARVPGAITVGSTSDGLITGPLYNSNNGPCVDV